MHAGSEGLPAAHGPRAARVAGLSVGAAGAPATGVALAAACCAAIVVAGFAGAGALGTLGTHMAIHIAIMNMAAPALAILLWHVSPAARGGAGSPARAATLQMALLWGWHAPAPLGVAHGALGWQVAMQVSLLLAALWFWLAVLGDRRGGGWRAILALLLTGKAFCLLGAVLTFAPRPLYPALLGQHHGEAHGLLAPLADQQAAGIMMLAACPATYVLAGIVIAARSLHELSSRSD